MPIVPMFAPVSTNGHTYQSGYADWQTLFHPTYLAHDGRLVVVGTWGSPTLRAVAERWGMVFSKTDHECPYCQGPLYALTHVPPGMTVARCIQQRDRGDGRIDFVLEHLPACLEQLSCEPCAQVFSAPKAV